MKRRNYLKTILLGAAVPCIAPSAFASQVFKSWPYSSGTSFSSDWQNWPDMKWAGPEYWGNRLQDWRVEDGTLVCGVTAKNRNLHLLPLQNPKGFKSFTTSVFIESRHINLDTNIDGCAGIRLGAKGPVSDYRSAAVFGKGLDVGLMPNGKLKIGTEVHDTGISALPKKFGLLIEALPKDNVNELTVTIIDALENVIFKSNPIGVSDETLEGNFALLADFDTKKNDTIANEESLAFSNWNIASETLLFNKTHFFGPICFAQYTLNKGKLKLTAQMAPIEAIEGHSVTLELKGESGKWMAVANDVVDKNGRSVTFEFKDYKEEGDVPYRIVTKIPLSDTTKEYFYEGTISHEPHDKNEIKTAVFSCNFHFGFPDADVVESMAKLDPDIVLFLGDQFYEGTGGFGATFEGDFDKLCLDYLRKWYMFGWSYRDIFRHKPCAIIPDDHDVYHGNIWGENGKKADNSNGFGASSQDSGGYKMPAKWVNMVQKTQTSHLPDAFDSTPVKQEIGVYYTHWNYAGISFAILEDRKFKSSPKNVLPKEAKVNNGWIMSDDFDIKKHKEINAELLGSRQEYFLEQWNLDWSNKAQMKVVLSQTNFATVATLPKGAKTGAVIPSLPIPKKGEYINGDVPTVDMDSNGWPAKKRDKAVEIIRKSFAFHIAGDQHLGSFIQYGLDDHADSGYAFAGPALNNIWPRRFWPNADSSKHSYENPAYTGNHIDGFGNKMTVNAVANPHQMNKEPELLHNRAVGFGMITFNKKERTIKTECWPRFLDSNSIENQYPGWPVTISQEDNYGRKGTEWLPTFSWPEGLNPVIQVFDNNNVLVYAIRPNNHIFRPKVFEKGSYKIIAEDQETGFKKVFQELRAKKSNRKKINLKLT